MESYKKLAAVLGWPIHHSLSPALHELWLRRYDINGAYLAIPCPPDAQSFSRIIDGLRAADFVGCNVTTPHKRHAAQKADALHVSAQKAGASNLLDFTAGAIIADNSDIFGFEMSLRNHIDINSPPQKALVLGAGGAAPAIIIALIAVGVTHICVANRTKEKAETLARSYPDLSFDIAEWDDVTDHLAQSDILVNTTSLGMSGQPMLPLRLDKASSNLIVADVVYTPLFTPLLSEAKSKGLRYFGGLDMFIYQAVPSFEAFFDTRPVVTKEERHYLEGLLEKQNK